MGSVASTQRDLDAVRLLYQDDQAAGTGTMQLQRDLITSLQVSFGAMRITTPADTVISVADTWYVAAGTWSLTTAQSKWFEMTTNGRLKYIGTPDMMIDAEFCGSMQITQGIANDVDACECELRIGSGAGAATIVEAGWENEMSATIGGFTPASCKMQQIMSTNDYLELWVRNETDTHNIQIGYGTIKVKGFPID